MLRRARLVLALAALSAPVAPAARAHDGKVHPPQAPDSGRRTDVLIADHGEPPGCNAHTYERFREFYGHLLDMGVIPPWLRLHDTGTVLMDADCPTCEPPSASPRLVDAWLVAHVELADALDFGGLKTDELEQVIRTAIDGTAPSSSHAH